MLEDFVLGMGTSVASALTSETIFEIVKCIADVDMLPLGRIGSKCEIFRFFNSGYAHYGNISIYRRRAFHFTVSICRVCSTGFSVSALSYFLSVFVLVLF